MHRRWSVDEKENEPRRDNGRDTHQRFPADRSRSLSAPCPLRTHVRRLVRARETDFFLIGPRVYNRQQR